MARASHLCANSTTSSEKTSTSTLSRCESAPLRKSTRSSTENIVSLCLGSRTTPTTTRSNTAAAREMTSTWPFVTGSYEPGQIAVIKARRA